MRKVTVYNTIGGNLTVVESSAQTWGDLQRDLDLRGVSYKGMTAVVGETQVNLESVQAQLLESDFRLFLMPQKVKSGADEWLIDWDGIEWNDADWNDADSVPEEFTFKTQKDLAIARAKKAQSYLQKVIDYLINDQKKVSTDPEVASLARAALEIQKNLGGLYD